VERRRVPAALTSRTAMIGPMPAPYSCASDHLGPKHRARPINAFATLVGGGFAFPVRTCRGRCFGHLRAVPKYRRRGGGVGRSGRAPWVGFDTVVLVHPHSR